MPTAWDDLILCTEVDVTAEITDLAHVLKVRASSTITADIEAYITLAKAAIRQRLMVALPDLFFLRNPESETWADWVDQEGTDALTVALDSIANPEELQRAAVAGAIVAILTSGSFKFTMDAASDATRLQDLRTWWECEYERRLLHGIKLIWLEIEIV